MRAASRRAAAVMVWLAFTGLATHAAVAQEGITRFPAKGGVPAGYPAHYAAVIAAAEREGKIVVHSTTDLALARPVIDDFQALYPRIEVVYEDMNSSDLYNAYLDDLQTSPTTADVLWSSAMDLQMRLAQSGQAMAYESPELANLPAWALWKATAFGTTFEPIAIAYDKRQVAATDVPRTHAELAKLLADRRDVLAGKVATYDIERSGLGFLLATQDQNASPEYWQLAGGLGATRAHVFGTTEAILARVVRGESAIGYNVLGSYAERLSTTHPSLGLVLPEDYTLVVTRVVLIGKKAASPNGARLFVDYLLSKRGQAMLGAKSGLAPVRTDLDASVPGASLARSIASRARPIPLTPDIVTTFPTRDARVAFVRKWQQAIATR